MIALLGLLGQALAAPSLTVGAPVEYDLIGSNLGLRPELLWRPIAEDSALNLRAAVGLLPGPEYLYLPASLGVRGEWGRRADWRVRPSAGLGVEAQNFVVTDHSPISRVGFYAELGAVWVIGQSVVGLQVAPELSLFNRPGGGMSLRLVLQRDLGQDTAG